MLAVVSKRVSAIPVLWSVDGLASVLAAGRGFSLHSCLVVVRYCDIMLSQKVTKPHQAVLYGVKHMPAHAPVQSSAQGCFNEQAAAQIDWVVVMFAHIPRPSTPQTLSSPLGAAILAKLDARRVELAMAAALLTIIVAEQAARLARRLRPKHDPGTAGSSAATAGSQQQQQQLRPQQYIALGSGSNCAAGSSTSICFQVETGTARSDSGADVVLRQQNAASASLPDCTVCLLDSDASFAGVQCKDTQHGRSSGSCHAAGDRPKAWQPSCKALDACDADADQQHSDVRAPLLPAGNNDGTMQDSRAEVVTSQQPPASSRASTWQVARAWLKVMGIGSIAGTLSGIMEGLTGRLVVTLVLF